MTRGEVFLKGAARFQVFEDLDLEAASSFGQMCEDLNPTIDASEGQLVRAIGELTRRWMEKLEARYGAPAPNDRPRVQTLDLSAYLNSCKID